MAKGDPPRLKKMALDLLRDHVFSDTPAWVTIDDVYSDCARCGFHILFMLLNG
jgi:hypothetical protein